MFSEYLKFSMSSFIILPPSPDPFTIDISTPFSDANFFARGEALILSLSLEKSMFISSILSSVFLTSSSSLTSKFSSTDSSSSTISSSSLGSTASLLFCSLETSFRISSIFSPFSPIIAITPSTGTDSPSLTPT